MATPNDAADMTSGLVDRVWWTERQNAYLRTAVSCFEPRSPLNVIDHLEWRRREPSHAVALDAIGHTELATWFVRVDDWKDCADFDILRLLHLWFGYRDELPPRVTGALQQRFVGFKYWYTDPTPLGVIDHRWYWSENHRLIFHTIELLAGQAFPSANFTSDNRSGDEHHDRATRQLHAWFDEKAFYGFSEWHSDVYYEKDLAAFLTLAEWTADDRIAERAVTFLDLLLFDMAVHLHRGNVGATHGRSYMKDKSQASDQPLFSAAKLLFDDTELLWMGEGADRDPLLPLNEGATLLARAARYRPPEVIRRIAVSARPMIDRECMGVRIDPSEPLTATPTREDGLSYRDPEMVPFWWDRSALTAWQVVELTMDTMDRHRLWEADLFAPFRPVRDVTGGDRAVARRLAHDIATIVNAGLLTEVNTITYRTEHVMLSTAQSYRPGCAGFQQHVWQATLDERAVVFTTHPTNDPWDDPTTFHDLDHYWTGSATLPRSVQHGAASIHLYAPAFPSPELDLLAPFRYLPYTHAFFPTEHFDEVVDNEHWTLARRGGGFVGLWSWRPVRWREHDPRKVFVNGLTRPFDLVAYGGATNVWIAEVGDADRWGDFAAFRYALERTTIEVRDLGNDEDAALGFEVRYQSPSEGRLRFSSSEPLVVDGEPVSVGGYPRFDNPFSYVERGDTTVHVADGGWSVTLDLRAGTRVLSVPG